MTDEVNSEDACKEKLKKQVEQFSKFFNNFILTDSQRAKFVSVLKECRTLFAETPLKYTKRERSKDTISGILGLWEDD